MKRTFAIAAAGLVVASTIAAAPAGSQARPVADHEVELAVGDQAHIDGGAPQGMNPGYFDALDGACNKDPHTYCEHALVHVVTEVPEDVERGRLRTTLGLTLTSPDFPLSDFDMVVWESNADGERVAEVGQSANGGYVEAVEQVSVVVSTTPEVQDAWFLVDVIYFLGGPNYDLDLTFG